MTRVEAVDQINESKAFIQCAFMAATPASSGMSKAEAEAIQTCCDAALVRLAAVSEMLEAGR